MSGIASATCISIGVGTATPLAGTPFSACSVPDSTVTCNQNVTVAKSNNNVCITTNVSPLKVNMGRKTLSRLGNGGQLGSCGNPSMW